MAYLSPAARAAAYNEYEFDDNDSLDLDDERDLLDAEAGQSDEDTEDASETDMIKKEEEFTEIKEQMYQDKLAQLKKQLQQLKDRTLPEYLKRLKKIEQQYKERLRLNDLWQEYEMDSVEKEYIAEKKFSVREFEEKKIELKENIIYELEEKRRNMDQERNSVELTGTAFLDSMDVKPITTRKLRRRPNDPVPMPEKRRKASPAQLNYALDEMEILEDLKIINKVGGKPLSRKPTMSHSTGTGGEMIHEARIDDGRLYFDKRWFHRGQPVFVESKEAGKVAGVIAAVGTQEIYIKKITDSSKMRIYLTQLNKGKYHLRRRNN
ncbi:sin3 histone deacetylase corepressor complex component SDS3-like [Lineus longissimus]|uniref:sin3 histone deacetylase corepressor complex component SDS3-like n=1 Tax=Lineus longissimus TaxID=88925 RepID=UPI00315DCAB9